MYKIASQEIDFHDQVGFLEQLSEIGDIPEFVKKAGATPRNDIPLDRFALVVVTEGGTFPKFALHNKAYTWVSAQTFPKTASALPERCAQVAASYIKQACETWSMDCPEGVLAYANPVSEVTTNVVELTKGAAEKSVCDYNRYRAGYRGEASKELLKQKINELVHQDHEHLVEAEQIGHELASKIQAWAIQGGWTLPSAKSISSMISSALPKEIKDRSTIKQVFVDRLEEVACAEKCKHASVTAHVQAKDSTGLGGRFPMHTEDMVKRAQEYFEDNYEHLAPKNRKELATDIVKCASDKGMFVQNELIRKYAGGLISRAVEGNVLSRKSFLLEKNAEDVLDQLYEARNALGAEKFAAALEEFDKQAGIDKYWDGHIKDPYLSTYEVTKVAQWTFRMGDDVINEQQLRDFANKHVNVLHGYVNEHIIKDLKLMPVEIFDSLPNPEKEIIIAKMEEVGLA